jgi:hypothetical protein
VVTRPVGWREHDDGFLHGREPPKMWKDPEMKHFQRRLHTHECAMAVEFIIITVSSWVSSITMRKTCNGDDVPRRTWRNKGVVNRHRRHWRQRPP